MSAAGYLCRCEVCGREARSGESPLLNGWPSCCGYTMTLVDNERFKANIDAEVGASFAAAASAGEGDTEA